MTAFLAAALLASAAPQASAPAEIDQRCYRLMAELARSEAPQVRALGLGAAQYFLGRIDSASPGFEVSGIAAVRESERPALVRSCAEALSAVGFDLRALGATLGRQDPIL